MNCSHQMSRQIDSVKSADEIIGETNCYATQAISALRVKFPRQAMDLPLQHTQWEKGSTITMSLGSYDWLTLTSDRGTYADVWGNRFPFRSKTKNNFRGIDISQPTPSVSLSIPSFSLVLNK